MPEMDGLALLKAVRADEELKALPFIMLTAANDYVHVAEAKLAGVTNYLVKPFTAGALKAKVTAAMGLS
jgi:two-component system, chemotaxis family, chemotaxis protein CheY